MKVVLFIDNLNSGGAQRQMVNLAIGLTSRVEVVLVTYAVGDHFQSELSKHRVTMRSCARPGKIASLIKVLKVLREERPDVLCAFLFTPSLIVLLTKLFFLQRSRVFVSERFIEHLMTDWSRPFCRLLYPLSEGIVANSKTQTEILRKKFPRLREKIFYIPNGVDIDLFRPDADWNSSTGDDRLNLIGVGRITDYKNVKLVIDAMDILRQQIPVYFRWIGRPYEEHGSENDYYLECVEEIRKRGLSDVWHWEGKRKDVAEIYRTSDLLIHASYGEGFPNVICEALASGLPIVASDVIDHPFIITEGSNGFLFDHCNSSQLVEKIMRYWKLDADDKLVMKKNCRIAASTFFSNAKMIDSYFELFSKKKHERAIHLVS